MGLRSKKLCITARADCFHLWRQREREKLLELYRSHLEHMADEGRVKKALELCSRNDS
jgi:hypothetical protein